MAFAGYKPALLSGGSSAMRDEKLRHFPAAQLLGHKERRPSPVVFGVHVQADLDQDLGHVHHVPPGRGVKHGLPGPGRARQVRTPADVATLLLSEMSMLEREVFAVVILDTRNRVLRHQTLYQGSLNQSQVRVAEVFQEAIRRNAAAIIVAHNHPSGDPSPSPEDIAVTRDLVSAGKLLGIDVLDHLVIGRARWVSLRERGLGFE